MVFIWLTNTINWMLSEYHLACIYIYRESKSHGLMWQSSFMLFSQLFFCLLTVFGFPFGWSYKLASFLKKKPYLTIVIFIQLRHTFTVSQTFSSLCKKNPTKKTTTQAKETKNISSNLSASFFVSFYDIRQNQQRLLILVTFNVPW